MEETIWKMTIPNRKKEEQFLQEKKGASLKMGTSWKGQILKEQFWKRTMLERDKSEHKQIWKRWVLERKILKQENWKRNANLKGQVWKLQFWKGNIWKRVRATSQTLRSTSRALRSTSRTLRSTSRTLRSIQEKNVHGGVIIRAILIYTWLCSREARL